MRQTAAALESTVPNDGHGVGNGDARQTGAFFERPILDTGHGIGRSIVSDG